MAITGTLYIHTVAAGNFLTYFVPLTRNLILARNSHVFIANLTTILLCSSCRPSRLCWNWLMTFVLYSLFLFIPFVYAFYQDLKLNSTIWSSTCGYVLNSFCYLDILLNCFTGYRVKNGNYIVLNQSLIIS